MQQIKVFKGLENDYHALEKEVNAWVAENNIKVVNIFGNIAPQTVSHLSPSSERRPGPSDVLLVVVYEKN